MLGEQFNDAFVLSSSTESSFGDDKERLPEIFSRLREFDLVFLTPQIKFASSKAQSMNMQGRSYRSGKMAGRNKYFFFLRGIEIFARLKILKTRPIEEACIFVIYAS